jgi:small subunit ribosomal protein S20
LPKIKSAIKRVELTERNRQRNMAYKSRVRTTIKKFLTALKEASQSPDVAKTALSEASSLLDRAASKGIMHKNTSNRYKARLAQRLNKTLAS